MPEFIMSAMWAGTDFTPENGATRLVPGSHQWPEERVAQEHEITQAVMPKGSVVLWLSRSIHGAGASTRPEGRVGFFHSYIADWVRQEENQYIAVSPEAARRLSLEARQLLGYRSSQNLGWVKGRDAEDLLTEGVSGNI
jgi:ectoine hydroxylase-related dioxygenase (phytanoyl-CoA dioxygenase family)